MRWTAAAVASLMMLPAVVLAETPAPVIGTSNTAPIEPAVAHPDEAPCVVKLFTNAQFGANAVDYSYDATACPGPWAKVVFGLDTSVQAGRQFDRTATVWLGGVNLLFGTTSEPRAALAPAWHVERDVTDLTSLFTTRQTGHVLIANYQSDVYTSTITAAGTLAFYPATRRFPAPVTPDLVIPLAADAGGDTVALSGTGNALSTTVTLPRNIERARIDVLSQGQNADEFWYTCVPDAQAGALDTCGGGAFRESEIAVDGQPAGFTPIYPWIFTGGIDPYLWEPIPGIQTLAFAPQSLELTPFAAVLSDGQPHTISLSVFGANNYFSATATLLLYLDHGATQVSGKLLSDTIGAPPTPSVNVKPGGSDGAGNTLTEVDTKALRNGVVTGLLHTSHGSYTVAVRQQMSFVNRQGFDVGNALDEQSVRQTTATSQIVDTVGPDGEHQVETVQRFPLTLAYDYAVAADGSASQATTVDQRLLEFMVATHDGALLSATQLNERVTPADTLLITAAGAIGGHTGTTSQAVYNDDCIKRHLVAENLLLKDLTQTSCRK